MNHPGRRPIVALSLLTFSPGQIKVQIVPLNSREAADPIAAARVCTESGVSVVAALSRLVTVEELSEYVPGVAACPDVEWIATDTANASDTRWAPYRPGVGLAVTPERNPS